MTKPADSKQAIPSPEDRVRAIREREQKATKGPWIKWVNHPSVFCENDGTNSDWQMSGNQICECEPDDLPDLDGDEDENEELYAEQAEANAEFIAHARADIPYLLSLVEELKGQAAELEGSREHTWEWITRHYGKLQDWARTVLPEPWSTQFFNCIANGLYDPIKDVGKTYICNAGFEVTPGGYFKMPTAEYQLLCDQMKRAEAAETEVALLTKRKDYHAEYVEAVEAAEKAQGERDEYKRQWNDVLAHEDRALARGRELERGLGVMREALRRIGDPAAKVDSLMEARMIARAALTPEPATKAEVQK